MVTLDAHGLHLLNCVPCILQNGKRNEELKGCMNHIDKKLELNPFQSLHHFIIYQTKPGQSLAPFLINT